MNYDPASNELLAVAKVTFARQLACVIGGGIAIGALLYLVVAIRAGF
jgi:hypothetical protein